MMNIGFYIPIAIFALLNITMTLGLYVTALAGQLSMATAAIAGIGGYGAAIVTVKFGLPYPVALVAAVCLGAFVGAVLAIFTAGMRDFILKLATLAFGEAVGVLAFNWDYIGGANSFTGLTLHTNVFECLLAALLALYVAWRFDGSRLGFAARAIRDDPLAASVMGISILHVRLVAFALGAGLVALAGAMEAHYVLVVSPSDLGFFVSLNYIIFPVVRRHPDPVGPGARRRGADHPAGSTALRERLAPDPVWPDSSCWWCCCAPKACSADARHEA